jgi:hypothetical protein
MNARGPAAVDLAARQRIQQEQAAFEQRLRQEQAAFEEHLRQSIGWSKVRQVVGYSSIAGLLSILCVSAYMLLSNHYSAKGVGIAFGSMLVLFTGVWKVALKGAPSAPVGPTTASIAQARPRPVPNVDRRDRAEE